MSHTARNRSVPRSSRWSAYRTGAGVVGTTEAENLLSLHQRQLTQILPVQPKHIESVEVLRRPAAQQAIELRLAVCVQVDDFAIQDRIAHRQTRRHAAAQRAEAFVRVPLARYQLNGSALYVCQRLNQ
jgi:hypothetical protein